jgi:hypothetical protein
VLYARAPQEKKPVLSSRRLIRTLCALIVCAPIIAIACATSEGTETIEFGSPKDDASAGTSGSGSGGSSGATGTGGTGTGSCSVAFCPSGGPGTPCCINPNGPCGVDLGTGCALPQTADF